MAIAVSPFAAGLGADIGGVDIRRPLSPADRDAIRAAWLANLVLRLRGQPMGDEEHMAFTRNFGELEYSAYGLVEKEYGVKSEIDSRGKTRPEIAVISNILERGKPIGGLGHGEAFWHTDSSFVEIPPAGSFLRAIEIPPEGGATYFLNMYSAYETLPEDLKERIRGREAVHAVTHSSAGEPRKGFENVTDVSKVPGARHPLVRIHPETGRKALFLGRRINAYIVGLPVAESGALLDRLWAHAMQEQFTWRQDWRVGDLIIWDNRCVMHRRDAFDPATRRLLHRTQTKGTRPV
ncbi:MAG TPA: TauD/TfdA family dioxygenase [Stellaceae bacterium]|nr:TauD/TfdA family dioxygenase [Stellaceae bacterium]